MSYTLFNRGSQCPICQSSDGKCKEGDYTILCMSGAGNDISPPGFRYIGDTANGGQWGKYIESDNGNYDPQARAEYEERKRLEAEETARKYQESLSVEERDREIRKLADQLDLSSEHRESLQKRGFTDEQIEQMGFFSVYRLADVRGIDPRLAGVDVKGEKLNFFSHSGIGCPIKNPNGLIIGYQTRIDNAKDNKYIWAFSKTKHRPNAPTSHLQNGELPLGYYAPSELKRKATGLCESPSIKPSLASQGLGQIMIGAAGGLHASSPKQLKEYLEHAAKITGVREVELYPDGGSLTNENVLKQYHRTIKLCKKWGFKIAIAWWNQSLKSDADVDELTQAGFDSIEYITSEKRFKALIRSEEEKAKEREIKASEDEQYQQLTQLTKQPWKTKQAEKLDLFDLLTDEQGQALTGHIYIVKAAKGRGKTEGIIPLVKNFSNIYSWYDRISLGREACHRLGLDWVDDLASVDTSGRFSSVKMGFCANRGHQMNPGLMAKNGLLLLDEFDALQDHIQGSTCNKGGIRPLIMQALRNQIGAATLNGGMVIAMSADISDKEVEFLESVAPDGVEVRVIIDEVQPDRGTVWFDLSPTPDSQVEKLLETLEDGKPAFVIDDCKDGVKGVKSVVEYIRQIHPEFVYQEINSDTSGSDEVKEFLKDINEESKKVHLIGCSPSVVSGISITNGIFKNSVFGFFNGVLTIKQISQAICRVRGAEDVYIWAAEQGLVYEANRSTDPKEIKAWYQRNYQQNYKHLLSFDAEYDPLTDEWDSPEFTLYCQNAAYRNLCMNDLRARLRERLEQENYTVIDLEPSSSDMVSEGLKAAWAKLDIAHAIAVANAELLSDEALEIHLNNPESNPSPEEKLRVEKTLIHRNFGEELIQATVYEYEATGETLYGYAAMCLKDRRGQYKRQLDNFYNLMADESEVISRDIAKEVSQLKHREGRFAADISWHTRKRKAREWLGLKEFLDPEKWFKPEDYYPMTNKAKDKPSMVKDCLNLSVEDISPGQIFGESMKQIGLDLDKKWASPSELKPGQKRFKYRKISEESWGYAQMYFDYKQAQNEERERQRQEKAQAEAMQADFEKERLERQFQEEMQQETEKSKPDPETSEDVLILDNGDEVVSIPLSDYKVGMRYYHLDWKNEWVGGKVIELNHAGMEGFLGLLDNGMKGYESKLEWLRVPKRELARR